MRPPSVSLLCAALPALAGCSACHSLDADRTGPHHRGVFGRRAGSVEGFAYSPALRRASIVWGRDTLDAWLVNPEALIPGQRMGYSVDNAVDRADIIAYLRQVSPLANGSQTGKQR